MKTPAENLERFFAYAAERERIRLKKESGDPMPWTSDPILQEYRFCNVNREDDKTTAWFAENIRDPLRDQKEVMLATVIFRWFNRIETGERLLEAGGIEMFTSFDREKIKSTLLGISPIITAAYVVKSPNGMSKLEGLLQCIDEFVVKKSQGAGWAEMAERLLTSDKATLQRVWKWMCEFPYLGGFMSYEVITDLRHTKLLERASDIMTWANAGPGAVRGLNRIHNRYLAGSLHQDRAQTEMQKILAEAQERELGWEMRTVEHTLCEFDKYERARLGQGQPKQKYNASGTSSRNRKKYSSGNVGNVLADI